ncbi:MAG: peptidase domain-containing ABC transporter [Bacteroidales bacterium]|nr:peptidase domain-containing ABC transporter [Bacteroidales bacterium]
MKSNKNLQKIFTAQHGEFSCGLACLAMIVKYHGGFARQEDLRAISGTNLQGTTLLGLYQAAEKLNFKAEGCEAETADLKKLKTPVILHVIKQKRIEHYIVCFGFENGKFTVADPAETRITQLTESELLEIWQSKTLLLLNPNENFVKQTAEKREKFRWFRDVVRDDYPLLTVAFILGTITAALGLASAIFSQRLIDNLLPSRDFEKIITGIFLYLFILLAAGGLNYIRSIFMLRQTRNINNRLIDRFFSKIFFLPKTFFDATKTGEIIARMNDSRRIQQTLSYIVGDVLIQVIILLLSIVYLWIYSWEMALIASLSLPLYAVLVALFNRKFVESQRNVMVSYAATESRLIDTLKGADEIKNLNKQTTFKQVIQLMYGIFQDCSYKLGLIANRFGLIAQIINVFISVGLIIVGVWFVLNDSLTLGQLMAVVTIGGMIINSTSSLSTVNIRLQEAGVAFDRFFEFVKTESEFETTEMAQEMSLNIENISLEINNLTFRFVGRSKLFDNVSLRVQTGEIVTLFGEVGSGKSTFIHILQKHYFAESGEILLNGKSYSDFSVPSWRNLMSVVSQQTKIFNATLGENICLGNSAEEAEQIVEFCREFGFDRFFNAFPQGLNTILGEDGINISGGQRQLVALARALYRQPKILLLDEPTAAMDTKTEKFVIDLLQNKKDRFATLMVTHRQYLAQISNKVYSLENGKVREITT